MGGYLFTLYSLSPSLWMSSNPIADRRRDWTNTMIEQPSYSIEQQDDDRYHCRLFGVDNGESPFPNMQCQCRCWKRFGRRVRRETGSERDNSLDETIS